MRVVICDDCTQICDEIERFVEGYRAKNGKDIEVSIFYSGEALCSYLEQGNQCDLIFLDIELAEMSGVDVGRFIRCRMDNYYIEIVFISGKESYAMDLFQIQPMDFLIKPIEENKVWNLLELYDKITGKKNLYYAFQKGAEEIRIPYDEIIGFFSEGRIIRIRTQYGEESFYGKLREIAKGLPQNFYTLHQSYIINTEYIASYKYDQVILVGGEVLLISKPNRKAIREKIMTKKRNKIG